MSSSKSADNRFVYREFGNGNSAATERPILELPPQQQNLKVQPPAKDAKEKLSLWLVVFKPNQKPWQI